MTLLNGISTAYSYDATGRLTGMKYSKGSTVLRDLVYGYDEINRRTSYSGNTAPEPQETATTNATVDASNRYTSLNGKSISHDENGNQTINNAVWDARNRLVGLSGPGFTASFTYDVMDRRTSKTVNGQTKTYLYDGSDLISETGADYTFGPGIDQPLERKSGQNEYYLSDALGSVIGLTDGNGAIKTSYSYSPFGKKQTTGTASSNPFAFTGREDDGTGYYYYRARYYSPDQKRFIAEDPLGFGGGDSNLYSYAGGDPVNFTDPSGNQFAIPVPQGGGFPTFPPLGVPGSLVRGLLGGLGGVLGDLIFPQPLGSDDTLKKCPLKHGAENLPDLTGKSGEDAEKALEEAGFERGSKTSGGYERWRNSDGSEIWVRPDGEIVRLGPKEIPEGKTFGKDKMYRPRYGPNGKRLGPGDSHNTGEILSGYGRSN
jgi:RHS repeat-associated protein